MTNKRGITLIEVLVSIVILSIAVLSVSYLLQQSSLFSKHNSDRENNVSIVRTVLEEIKASFNKETVSVYGQQIQISLLKNSDQSPEQIIYAPNSTSPKVKLVIKTIPLPSQATHISIEGKSYNLNENFRLVQVTGTDIQTSQPYVLQSYLESQ